MIKKLNPVVTELFVRGIKSNISIVFITQSYFFGMNILNQNIKTMQNYVIRILTALLFILKRKSFLKIYC